MIVIEKQGAVIVAHNPHHRSHGPKDPPKRGTVTEFSQKSRRRMLLLLNRCDYSCRVTFLTLTFHGTPTVPESNAAFKRFTRILRRMFPDVSAIWRRELQPLRGSIHFHLLVFHLPYWNQRSIQALWTRCTGEDRSIVHVQFLKGRERTLAYAAKYVAKRPDAVSITSLDVSPYQNRREKPPIGRSWGYINKDGLPLAETTVYLLDDPALEAEIWLTANILTNGRCGNDANMLILFSSNAEHFVQAITARGRVMAMVSPNVAQVCMPTHHRPNRPAFEALWQRALA